MKKLPLAILILIVIVSFALADYYVNLPQGISNPISGLQGRIQAQVPDASDQPNITKQILEQAGLTASYTIEKRTRSTELFEIFDLSDLANIGVYKNIIIRQGAAATLPIYVYEIHGPVGQGNITYLNIKLTMIEQLGSAAGINETGDYGFSSLFYNDEKTPSIGYLLSQVGDVAFGFKYSKESQEDFDFIKSLVNNYMSQVSNNS